MCDFHAVDFLGFKNIRVFFSRKQAVFCKKAGLKNFTKPQENCYAGVFL